MRSSRVPMKRKDPNECPRMSTATQPHMLFDRAALPMDQA